MVALLYTALAAHVSTLLSQSKICFSPVLISRHYSFGINLFRSGKTVLFEIQKVMNIGLWGLGYAACSVVDRI